VKCMSVCVMKLARRAWRLNLEDRKTNRVSNNHLVMIRDNTDIKNQISKNIDDYNCVIKRIDELKSQVVKLNALIKREEERYQIMAQDAMKGHEIMQFIKNLTDQTNHQRLQQSY